MNKKIFMKVLLVSFLVLLISPLSLHAEGITKLVVNGTIVVNDEGEVTENTSGSGWSFEGNTLTLNGYNGGAISTVGDLIIQVRGNNTIKSDSLVTGSNGIYINGILTIRGNALDYSDTLNIMGYDYAIATSNDKDSEFVSVDISQATLTVSNSNYGIFALNSNAAANNVKQRVVLGNSVVSMNTNNTAIILRGSSASEVVYTRLAESYEFGSTESSGNSYVTFFVSGTSRAKTLNLYPGYKITYNLTLLSLTSGSSTNFVIANNDFGCGFNVDSTDYALPTSVTVKVNGVELAPERFSYNSTTGLINISKDNINGDIEITAAAVPCDPNPQTGTLEVVIKLGLSLGLVGVIILAKSLKLV